MTEIIKLDPADRVRVADAAIMLGVSAGTIWRRLKAGALVGYSDGYRTWLDRTQVEAAQCTLRSRHGGDHA